MTDENDLRVATQLGEIRAALRNIESKLEEVGDFAHRINEIEKQIIGFKAQVAVVASLFSIGGTLVGWMVLNWQKIAGVVH